MAEVLIMTPELLKQYAHEVIEEYKAIEAAREPEPQEPPYVYGIKGIRQMFQCGVNKAQWYKDNVLMDACSQDGRKIVVNTKKARELHKAYCESLRKRRCGAKTKI